MDEVEPGLVLGGRFRVEARLGRGVFGEVYRATQLTMGRAVALKILRAESLRSEHSHLRFGREAQLLSRLAHPNIVQVFDFGIDEHTLRPYIVLELIAGSTLVELLRSKGPLAERPAARVLEQIARALAHAHHQGIIHRDLKPANIMISDLADGRESLVKVLDFGLAKLLLPDEARLTLTAPGQLLGTPNFASPEQTLGDQVDERSDLYSLGCVLFAALTARAPFATGDVAETIRLQRHGEPPPLPAKLQDGRAPSPEITALYRELLAKRPSDRPSMASEVADRLAALGSERMDRESEDATHVVDAATELALSPPGSAPTEPVTLPPAQPITVLATSPELLGTEVATMPPEQPPTELATSPSAFLPTEVGPTVLVPRARRRAPLALLLVAVAVAMVAAASTISRREEPRMKSPTAPPAAVTSAEPKVAASPQVAPVPMLRVRVETTPPGADAILDGEPIGTTPLDLELEESQLPRSLRLLKAGYLEHSMQIDAASPASVELQLQPRPAKRSRTPKRPPENDPGYPIW